VAKRSSLLSRKCFVLLLRRTNLILNKKGFGPNFQCLSDFEVKFWGEISLITFHFVVWHYFHPFFLYHQLFKTQFFKAYNQKWPILYGEFLRNVSRTSYKCFCCCYFIA